MKKELEEKKASIEKSFIRISDHETILNEKMKGIQKDHELEMLKLTSSFEEKIENMKNVMEKEIENNHLQSSSRLAES